MGSLFSTLQSDDIAGTEANSITELRKTMQITAQQQLAKTEKQKLISDVNYVKSARLICGILFNYPFGINSSDPTFEQNISELLTQTLNADVFNLLCNIQQLVPVLWPTGSNDDSFHSYIKDTATGNVILKSYSSLVNKLLPNYITGNLKTYLSNVMKSNCFKYLSFDESKKIENYGIYSNYIALCGTFTTDEMWITGTYSFIKSNDDIINWKGLYAKSKKGYCNSQILVLPSNYPEYIPKYELYQAFVLIFNTIIGNVGSMRTENGELVSDTYTGNVTAGGMCIKYNSDLENSVQMQYITNKVWDKSFKYVTNKSDALLQANYMNISEETSTEIYYISASDKINQTNKKIRYVNPTKFISKQFIYDDDVSSSSILPLLSVKLNDVIRTNLIKDTISALEGDTNYNILDYNNKSIFSSIDYMLVTPNGWNIAYPISKFAYDRLVTYNSTWNIIIPVSYQMTNGVINTNMKNNSTSNPLSVFYS